MSQYLSKEEIKQWRSSLEKITLEEYARKLGKVLEEDKKTSDLIDIVMKNEKRLYSTRETLSAKKSVLKVAQKAMNVQKEVLEESETSLDSLGLKLTYLKSLSKRENRVLAHFAKNEGKIVFAKDLAMILDLPCDYVYKYIKNLRTKIKEDILQNATKGGYIFNSNNN